MGIYDRDYYRREGPSFLDSFNARNFACKWIVLTNVALFVLQYVGRGSWGQNGFLEEWFALDIHSVEQGQVWRLITYAFLHDTNSIFHILFNMLFLWMFGTAMEDIYGTREFLAFYLTAAVVAGLGFVGAHYVMHNSGTLAIGASGAVSAAMVLFALHYPRHTIIFWVVPVPVWLFVLFCLGQDLLGFLGDSARNRVGFSAHLAGAAFGFIYYHRSWRILNIVPDLRSWSRQRARPAVRIYREDPPARPVAVPASTPPATAVERMGDEQLEAKLDAVLEKVARSGKESLTEGEQAILLRASEIYKRRRS
jgi:membrane associated rhomboid family serine protease